MVNALIKIDENANRILNMVKAKYGLKDKGEAINLVIKKYIEQEGEPELKPEFIKKINEIERQKSIKIEDFSEVYGLN
jgi:hypothetical protein